MSGRKQHYIPQFLLRSFAESGSGKKLRVKVLRSDDQFIVPTDGIAAQREFYSAIEAETNTLDDVITDAETYYFDTFNKLKHFPPGVVSSGYDVARLLVHLCVRGHHWRSSTTMAGSYALKRASDLFSDKEYVKRVMGVGRSTAPDSVRKALDKLYNEHQTLLGKRRISRHEFRRIMFRQMTERWDESAEDQSIAPAILDGMINVQRIVRDAHNKALVNDLEPQQRVTELSKLEWTIKESCDPVFILPDSIALGHGAESVAMPLLFVEIKDLEGVIFPLSPTRALCAGIYSVEELFRRLTANFSALAARASWEFCICLPSSSTADFPGHLIGSGVGSFIYDTVETSIQEAIVSSLSV